NANISKHISYRLHGFTANCERGKYTATCNFCDRVLQNTALTRLALHRQTCERQRNGSRSFDLNHYIENRHLIEVNIEIEKVSPDDDDGMVSDNEGKEIIVKVNSYKLRTPEKVYISLSPQIQQILDAADDGEAKKALVKSETCESTDADIEAEQHMEFEISGAEYLDDSKENYILPHQLENSTNSPTMFLESRPKNSLATLKAEKMRAEIRHFQSKTKFLKTETDNLKLERTLALLKIQKLRLEIDALRG
ncbi:hypothetical protein KR054_001363, partial [Drosophila jambulina]